MRNNFHRIRGFTLTEVLVSLGLTVVLLALVLGVVVSQSKFGLSVGNYSDMNEYSRKALTVLENDMRMTRSINAYSDTSVEVNVINSVTGTTELSQGPAVVVYYALQKSTQYPGKMQLIRQSPKGSGTSTVLDGIEGDGKFAYIGADEKVATTSLGIKKIIFTCKLSRSFSGITNSDYLVSAVVVMRSKPSIRL